MLSAEELKLETVTEVSNSHARFVARPVVPCRALCVCAEHLKPVWHVEGLTPQPTWRV